MEFPWLLLLHEELSYLLLLQVYHLLHLSEVRFHSPATIYFLRRDRSAEKGGLN